MIVANSERMAIQAQTGGIFIAFQTNDKQS